MAKTRPLEASGAGLLEEETSRWDGASEETSASTSASDAPRRGRGLYALNTKPYSRQPVSAACRRLAVRVMSAAAKERFVFSLRSCERRNKGGGEEEQGRRRGGIRTEERRNKGGGEEEQGRRRGGIRTEERRNKGGGEEEQGRRRGGTRTEERRNKGGGEEE
ncbi:hypothetical protein EYF80_035164 [Liparis tanakae]|uniref:Uncharacterized protein n=1 Tax=Liparis tanakae TaxID=230148 RepID=A0A4Z2GPI9_9TELE|nr:hypothetical protein EYF80_035164 [Liparis tanakae]